MITYNQTNRRMMGLLALMLVLGTMLAPVGHAQTYYSVRIENGSSYAIRQVYLSPASYTQWGRDVLGADTLWQGYVLTTHQISGMYDLKLVDSDGDVCIVRRVALYSDTNWRITNDWLLGCEWRSVSFR
jgi:hypothetical protein